MKAKGFKQSSKGMTLVEVMVAVVLVAAVGVGIILAVLYGLVAQQRVHELHGATRVAAERVESLKRIPVRNLRTVTNESVVISNNSTIDNEDDDIRAELDVTFYRVTYDEDGVIQLAAVANPEAIPERDLPLLMAEVSIQWTPAGRKDSRTETVVMETLLAP